MHELSLAKNILDIIMENAQRSNFSKVLEVKLRIGKLRAVDPGALDFCFNVISKDTIAGGAKLKIENTPLKGNCRDCKTQFEIQNFNFICPNCSGKKVDTIGGDELQILDLEVE